MDNQKIQHHNTLSLIQDLRQFIEQSRGKVAATANYAQTMMYWHLGEQNHDRFLIVDDNVYLLGASVKDMGNGLCAVTKLTATPETVLGLLK